MRCHALTNALDKSGGAVCFMLLFVILTTSRRNWYFLRVTVRHRRCSASGTKLSVRSVIDYHSTPWVAVFASVSGKNLGLHPGWVAR